MYRGGISNNYLAFTAQNTVAYSEATLLFEALGSGLVHVSQSYCSYWVGELVSDVSEKNKTLTYLLVSHRESFYGVNTHSNWLHEILKKYSTIRI